MLKHLPALNALHADRMDHALNWGLEAHYRVAPFGHPAFFGGNHAFDLCRKWNGTMTSGANWEGALGRQGGFGSYNFDATNDTITTSLTISDAYTVTGWIRFHSTGGDAQRTVWVLQDHLFYCRPDIDVFVLQDDSAGIVQSSTIIPTVLRWYFYVVAYDGSGGSGSVTIYLASPGFFELANYNDLAQTIGDPAGGTNFQIGYNATVGGLACDGNQDGIRVYKGRTFNLAQATQLYEDELSGCLKTLNIRSRIAQYLNTTAAPAGDAVPQCWAQYRQRRAA